MSRIPPLLLTAAAIGFASGLTSSVLWSSDAVLRLLPRIAELQPIGELEPIRALPRTSMVLAMEEARGQLSRARPWAAWSTLSPYLDEPDVPGSTIVLAARAAAGWGGWREVRQLLIGVGEGLDRVDGGEGWALLGRAEEELGRSEAAILAYGRHARVVEGREHALAQARLGRLHRDAERAEAAAAAFHAAAAGLPELADWLHALEAESLALASDARVVQVRSSASGTSTAARVRRVRADATGLLALADTARALQRLQQEAAILSQQGAAVEAAAVSIDRARLLSSAGRSREGIDLLRAVAWESTLPADLRLEAAAWLGAHGGGSAAEELARASAYEAGGRHGMAARSLRAALAAGAADEPAMRLRLGRLLFEAGDFSAARPVLLAAAEQLRSAEQAAEAELLAARARFRGGDRSGGLAELRLITQRRAGTAAAGSALFLLADAAAKIDEAIPLYRRAAGVRDAPESREALQRLGDRLLRRGDTAGALRAWEEYVARYPSGEATAQIAYDTGVLHARSGRRDAARAMYTAAMLAEPLSYYAFRAGERIAVDPLARVLEEPRPWVGLAADAPAARVALGRLEALAGLRLQSEWREELDAVIRSFEDRPLALITLAEGLRDGGHTVEAIRLGRRLAQERDGWDARLLRVVFPLPYRDLLEQEAARHAVDPMLLAGLVRQESTFRPAVRSRVGATGLAQIMPATGRWIAPRVGVPAERYEERLLSVPEINLRMGALYLGDMLRRYDGAADLALAAYNAGPGRADRWRRELRHDSDVDRFRDAIPFDETRHYVKVVLRNAAVYERLYSPGRAASRPAPILAE